MKQMLLNLGRWLILRNYVYGDADSTILHDLRVQARELRRENFQLRQKALIEQVRRSCC